jgi:electron transfer flavoprotein beta subunit
MNIAVCVCQVPDTASVIGFAGGVVDRSRVNEVMNPYDEYALEEAVRLKERFEGSVVTVFSIVPAAATEIMRKALAMGADRAVVVNGREEADPYLTALVLSKAIAAFYSDSLPDLVLCGKHSTDFQHEQVPSMLGALLGVASVNGITALEVSGELLHVEREIEGGIEYLDLAFPAVLSAEKGLNQPRKTSIRAVMEARKKNIDHLEIIVDERPYVLCTRIEPIVRKKICRFLEDEKKLLQLLGNEGVLC